MGFGHLPNIEDYRLLLRIARLQNHDDFRLFKEWLLKIVPEHLMAKTVVKPDDNKLEIGVMQALLDLEDLFNHAQEWAIKLQEQEAKKKTT